MTKGASINIATTQDQEGVDEIDVVTELVPEVPKWMGFLHVENHLKPEVLSCMSHSEMETEMAY